MLIVNGFVLYSIHCIFLQLGGVLFVYFGLIITSGKSEIWPWGAPKNQGFRKLCKLPRGKDLGTITFGYITYERR
jgi:hypothetical protein